MAFYADHIVPHIVSLACSVNLISEQRRNVIPKAGGRVLEIGMGSGLNLPFYDATRVTKVFGLEPSALMRKKARKRMSDVDFDVAFIDPAGAEIPLEDHSVDSVVTTYTLCTIPDAGQALMQMHRVLKPTGRLIFCEHGAAPDSEVLRWQHRCNRVWGALFGGCSLVRAIPRLIEDCGFTITSLEQAYLPRTPRIAGYNYWGLAKVA